MIPETTKNIKISPLLERVLKQLERVTKTSEKMVETPAHGGEDGRDEKDFPRVLGHA